jgi:subtilisin-like proprotein convertase family protein
MYRIRVGLRIGSLTVAVAATLAVMTSPAAAATFSNSAAIAINDPTADCDVTAQGPADPYPSPIQVSDQSGSVTDANVTITGFSHTYPADVRILLVGPQGQTTDLMDESGGTNPVSDLTLTFDDAAADPVPDPAVSGTFKPTQDAVGCTFDENNDYLSPAPASPYATDLSGFNGTDPNGTWSLYIVDNALIDTGSISGGWSLDLAGVSPAQPQPTTKDPKCARLHKKLRRQKRHLARTVTATKRSKIQANIQDTKDRLKRLGC